jgi:hypothetical protein
LKTPHRWTDISYRYSYGFNSGRAYIFTRHDFANRATTNICVNLIPETKAQWIEKVGVQVGLSNLDQPLALHRLLTSHALHRWNIEGTCLRVELFEDVSNPKLIRILVAILTRKRKPTEVLSIPRRTQPHCIALPRYFTYF